MLLIRKVRAYIAFAGQCVSLLADQKIISAVFVALSVLAALTEGVSISLLVPILDTQGGSNAFANAPLLGTVSSWFEGMSPSGRIQVVAVMIGVAVVLRNALQYLVDVLSATIPLRLEYKLNLRSYSALMAVELAYVQQSDYGNLLNGLGGLSQRVTNMLASMATALSNLLTTAVYVMLMLAVSWKLTATALIFLVAISAVMKMLTTGPLQRAGKRMSAAAAKVNQTVMESLTGIKLIHLAAAEPLMKKLYVAASDEFYGAQRRASYIQALGNPVLTTSAGLFICLLLFVSAAIHAGEPASWLSSILLFLVLLFRLVTPVSNILTMRNRIAKHMHAFEMLSAFYEETAARSQSNGVRIPTDLSHGIVFDNVTFGYKQGEAPVISRLSLKIERGKVVAIVGPSGAGKSTLVSLLARLYDPAQGRILVDGVDLRHLEISAWRKQLAIVSQDTFIFNDTVANNITFGHDGISRQQIESAAQLAAAAEFIEKLPQEYNTPLGDRGTRLSGGQQQRIAIARAVLADPDVLILDEATSSLDTFTERAIQDAMTYMAADRTLLVIAHRLSTIRHADKVVVMEHGRIVEEGSHSELLARRGSYWEMVAHQRLDLADGEVEKALAEVRR